MKTRNQFTRIFALSAVAIACSFASVQAQKLAPDQVPAAVQAAFAKTFPQALDIEWKMKGTQYQVEFETGLFSRDHEVWYDAEGKELRHKEELSASDLPEAVSKSIAAEFPGYRLDDVDRISMGAEVTYLVELKMRGQSDWNVAYSPEGKQLRKELD